ncbi:hypothetical protein BU16DRAFT_373629 [Lophium mytilinum]|uniref:F-box domain-containing protein n=1 Tax=Lophium mytilinum TaxID=390894 RepID=A0A6A6QV47_9PEZI|nr:hypothetical protein BU16DRAFT_373629 [Lophium mytilinum]
MCSHAETTRDAPNEPRTPTTNPQMPSRLLQLPGELRNMIYTHLLSSTWLTFGGLLLGHRHSYTGVATKCAPNPLSILRTCRQIDLEASSLCLGHVLFNFEGLEALP